MKTPVWKLVLVCMMLIALPLKGVAGIASALCDAQHRALYPAAQVVDLSALDGSVPARAEHHHPHPTSASNTPAGESANTDGSQQKCSVCGACCVGTALAAEPLVFASPLGGDAVFPEPFSRHVGPVPHGLDRPPQALLA